jgi:hypothetical protein
MWTEVKIAGNLMLAEMWKEYFEAEGVPVLLSPAGGGAPTRELTTYSIMVPGDKKHIIDEVIRNL